MLTIRSLVFYLGYSLTLMVYALFCTLIGWAMPIHARYRLFMKWNVFVNWWLKIICGVGYHIQGMENLPSEPYVLASNHQSPWETLFLYEKFLPISAILKKELLDIPFFGWALRLLQPIAIDRSKPSASRTALLAQGAERLNNGISVLVFPEGTRVAPGQQKKLSIGAAELAIKTGAKLVPLAHNAGLYWPAHRLIKNPGTIQVVIGQPIDAAGRDPRELTEELQKWMYDTLSRMQ